MPRSRKRAGDADRDRWIAGVGEVGAGPGVTRSDRQEQQTIAMLHAAQSSEAWAQTRKWAGVQGSLVVGASDFAASHLEPVPPPSYFGHSPHNPPCMPPRRGGAPPGPVTFNADPILNALY